MTQVSMTINGKLRRAHVEPRMLLVHFLREQLNLTGTHVGCDTSQCGACTVIVDGRSAKSCTIFAVQADGSTITTIEGLAGADRLHPLQEGFWEEHGLQCGYCTPGMIMAAVTALDVSHGRIRSARIGLTGAGPNAIRLRTLEEALAGKAATNDTVAAAAQHAAADLTDVNSDIHASAEYRRAMVPVFARRALKATLTRV